MQVTAIVLNWNRRDDALACLSALAAQAAPGLDLVLLLVDNGSTDDSVAAVRAASPAVQVLPLPSNRGYAAGTNAGLRWALGTGADWMLLVNNDALPRPGMLAELLAAGREPVVGMVAPTIYYADAPARVWPSAGWRRRTTLAAFDTTAHPPTREPYEVDWATGCCLLVRRAVWEAVGLFDERYFFYYEDHDLCLRARRADWRIVHAPAAAAWHRVAASTGHGSPRQAYLLARSSVPFYLGHTRGAHRAFIVVYRLVCLGAAVVRSLAKGRPAVAAATVRGLVDGARDVATRPARTPSGAARP